MLRRTLTFHKITRNWSKKSLTATAHFPQSTFVDPALQRDGAASAKEKKAFKLDEETSLPEGHKGPLFDKSYAFKRWMYRMQRWTDLVRVQDPAPTMISLFPAMWGCGFAMTRLLVWEGADPIVLCAPLLPIHLLAFFFVGSFLLRGSLVIGYEMIQRRWGVDSVSPSQAPRAPGECGLAAEDSIPSPLLSGSMGNAEAGGLLGAQALITSAFVLNLAPAAGKAFVCSLPFLVAIPFLERWQHPKRNLVVNWVRACGTSVGVFVGYAAVAGRVDFSVTLPLYVASVSCAVIANTLKELQIVRQHEQQAEQRKILATRATRQRASLFDREGPTSTWQSVTNQYGDIKFYLNVLVVPAAVGFVLTGLLSSQCLFYYLALIPALMYLQGIIDHVNVFDPWSCKMNYARHVRFGFFVMICVGLSNAFWGLATEHNPKADRVDSSNSTLQSLLRLNQTTAERRYDASDFNSVDRFVRPAWVQARVMQLESELDVAVIPPWMRREHLGQNLSSIVRWCGIADDTVTEWEKWWYAKLDHYNVFTKFVF